jgi:pimeloyl-ACP methyl ester carboxylesterase
VIVERSSGSGPIAFVDTAGGRFAYVEAGPPAGRLVVCLHGFPDHPESFARLLERLAASGYRAVAPWMRGYAPSVRRGPYHGEQLADDALAIARALAGGHPFALIGHDWGAVAAWIAGSRSPSDLACAVTLAVPHPLAFLRYLARSPGQMRRSWYMGLFQLPGVERLLPLADFALIDRLWRAWSPGFELEAGARRRLHDCLAASLPGPIEYYRAMVWPPREAAARARAAAAPERRVTAPVLYLHGERDGCIDPAASHGQRRLVAGPFECELVAGAGHFLHLEDPDQVGGRALHWLRAHFPPTLAACR